MNDPHFPAPVTTDEARRLRESFLRLIPVSQEAACAFYERVFERMPDVRPLFSTDIVVQGEKFMKMLAVMIDAVDSPAKLRAECMSLGYSHNRHGVTPEMYPPVGEALVATLAESLRPEFDADTEHAWKKLYHYVSQTMIQAQER